MADLDALVLAASGDMAGGRQSEVRKILLWLDALVIAMLLMVVHYFIRGPLPRLLMLLPLGEVRKLGWEQKLRRRYVLTFYQTL